MPEEPQLKKYLEHLSLGTEIAVAIGAPILIGYWLDSRFESSPKLSLIGVAVGCCLFFVTLYRLVKKYNK